MQMFEDQPQQWFMYVCLAQNAVPNYICSEHKDTEECIALTLASLAFHEKHTWGVWENRLSPGQSWIKSEIPDLRTQK